MAITIVDTIMGGGKTSWAIDFINNSADRNIMYITPFLKEISRIQEACINRNLISPTHRGRGKLESLNELLSCGEDIAATHELFKYLNHKSRVEIVNGRYTLILDEVLDVVEPILVKPDTVKLLKESGCISINDDKYVEWDSENHDYDTEEKIMEIKRYATNHSLMCVNDTMLLWRYPPEIFSIFDQIFILTYLFEGSILRYYFDLFGIKYEKKSVSLKDGKYVLCDYYAPNTEQYEDLIEIYNGKLNDNFAQKDNGLSVTWLKAGYNKNNIRKVQKNLYNYFTNITKAKAETIMWTTLEEAKSKLKGNGYSKGFIAHNCRSTNEYGDRYNLAYCINKYPHAVIATFFADNGIKMDQDLYALSELLQWIWRSRIRNGQKIKIYIPSKRMRRLLNLWLTDALPSQDSLKEAS